MSLFLSKVAIQVNVITCPRRMDDLAAKNFDIFAARWLELDVKAHVLNFKAVEEIDATRSSGSTRRQNER